MNASKYFGIKMRELRKKNSLTAGQLALRLDCSPSLVYNIERGLNRPQPELIVNVARFFGVTTDYLLQEENFDNEKEIIELCANLDSENKMYLFCLVKLMANNQYVPPPK